MALVLWFREGDAIRVDAPGSRQSNFVLEKITPAKEFVLHCEGGDRVSVVNDRAEEIMPNVWVSAGDGGTGKRVKMVIEAPREISITRIPK